MQPGSPKQKVLRKVLRIAFESIQYLHSTGMCSSVIHHYNAGELSLLDMIKSTPFGAQG